MAKQDNSSFEQKLFKTVDKLRKNIDAAEYKHVVLGLVFLKYISESFTELYEKLEADEFSDAEDRDEYIAGDLVSVEFQPHAIYSHAMMVICGVWGFNPLHPTRQTVKETVVRCTLLSYCKNSGGCSSYSEHLREKDRIGILSSRVSDSHNRFSIL